LTTVILETHYILLDTFYTLFTVLNTRSRCKHTVSTDKLSVFSNRTENIPQPHIGKGTTRFVTGDPYITCEVGYHCHLLDKKLCKHYKIMACPK